MTEKILVIGIAIALCIIMLGVLYILDQKDQTENSNWTKQMKADLKESLSAKIKTEKSFSKEDQEKEI